METDRDTLPCVADNGSTDTGTECFNISFGIHDFSLIYYLKNIKLSYLIMLRCLQ